MAYSGIPDRAAAPRIAVLELTTGSDEKNTCFVRMTSFATHNLFL